MRRIASFAAALSLAAPALAQEIESVEFQGELLLPQDLTVDGQRFGGISGLAYDPESDRYLAIADDLENARFFELRVDLGDGSLDEGDVVVERAVLLEDVDGRPFAPKSLDPEGIAVDADGDLFVAAEPVGDKFPAFIRRYEDNGAYRDSLPVDPLRYDPRFDEARGARGSGGFESLTLSDDKRTLYAAFEIALKQDGEGPTFDNRTTARILEYDLALDDVVAEYVYLVEPRTLRPAEPDGQGGIGLNDLLWVDENTFLSVERQWAQGVTGGTAHRPVKMFVVSLESAEDVLAKDALAGDEATVAKRLLLDFDELLEQGVLRVGSHEAVIFGPDLPDGRRSLLLIEDSDFERPTQVLLFAVNEAS